MEMSRSYVMKKVNKSSDFFEVPCIQITSPEYSETVTRAQKPLFVNIVVNVLLLVKIVPIF